MDSNYRIDCTKCRDGFLCCRVENTSIDLTLGDVFRISDFLRISPKEFLKKHVALQALFDPAIPINELPLFRVSADIVSPCRFLVDGVCSIQSVKPVTCLSFPGKIINQKINPGYWKHFYNCIKDYSSHYFPYVDALEELYEAEGGNLVERVFGFGFYRDCIEEGNMLKEKEKEIYQKNIPLVEKDDLFMAELRELIKPLINNERITYQRLSGDISAETFDREICLNVKEELINRVGSDLAGLRMSVKETTKEYFYIREKYGI